MLSHTMVSLVCCPKPQAVIAWQAVSWLEKAVVELGQDDVDWEDADLECLHQMPAFLKVREYFEERFGAGDDDAPANSAPASNADGAA